MSAALHPLDDPWPPFLDQLDASPSRAFDAFYDFAQRLLEACPPRALRQVPEDLRQDLIHDVVLRCTRDDFRALRRYRDRGKPFAAWLLLAVRNRVLDHLRAKGNAPATQVADGEGEEGVRLTAADAPPDRRVDMAAALSKVTVALRKMDETCRILLQGTAEGYKPRELTGLLGWPSDWNKKASDHLRECRKKLKHLLSTDGLGDAALQELITD